MIHNLILVHREMDFFSVLDLGKLNCSYSRSWKRTVLVWWGCWYLWNTKCHKKESIELQNDPSEAFLHSQLPRTLAALQGGKSSFLQKRALIISELFLKSHHQGKLYLEFYSDFWVLWLLCSEMVSSVLGEGRCATFILQGTVCTYENYQMENCTDWNKLVLHLLMKLTWKARLFLFGYAVETARNSSQTLSRGDCCSVSCCSHTFLWWSPVSSSGSWDWVKV